MLKPRMSSLWPLKSCLTRLMTPSVLILHAKKRSGRAGEPFPVATQIIHCQWQHSEPWAAAPRQETAMLSLQRSKYQKILARNVAYSRGTP